MDQEQIESDLFNAEEIVKRSDQYAQHSKKLFDRGYISEMTLKADVFAAKKALEDQKVAKTKKRVLNDYTKKKTEIQLNSDIRTAAAKSAAQDATHRLDKERLDQINAQVAKCVIRAPEPGQVVYANNNERWGGQEIIIEEGATVRERQVLFKLPDPKRMQVKAKVNESKIAMVREGQPVVIHLDAFPDVELAGEVQKVNEYPAQSSWWSNIKEYETIVRIYEVPVLLRPGLTAEVKIRVAFQPNVLQVPVQAVFEHGGHDDLELEAAGAHEGVGQVDDQNERQEAAEEVVEIPELGRRSPPLDGQEDQDEGRHKGDDADEFPLERGAEVIPRVVHTCSFAHYLNRPGRPSMTARARG